MHKFAFSPVVKISFSIAMLTASLLLLADFLGFYPNTEKAEIAHRKAIAESLAVQLSTALSNQELLGIESTLLSVVNRNETVLSAALRQADGSLLFASSKHSVHWKNLHHTISTTSQIQVSIFDHDIRWGNVELSFQPLVSSFLGLFSRGSVFGLVLFIVVLGFICYTLLLKKVLHELNSSDVFPERVSKALDSLAEGILLIDDECVIIFANESFSQLLGAPKQRIPGLRIKDLDWKIEPNHSAKQTPLWQMGLQQPISFKQQAITLIDYHGKAHALTANATTLESAEGVIQGALLTFDDISATEHKNRQLEQTLKKLNFAQAEITEQNKKLLVLATRDPLTNALNRRALLSNLETLLAESHEETTPLCFIMVDIDHFKNVNDNHGHAVGDLVIQSLVHSLSLHTRASDLLARLGGEEFCVVLPSTGEDHGFTIAERMRASVEQSLPYQELPALRITASFGLSTLEQSGPQPAQLMELADQALYRAKTSGRNRVIGVSDLASLNGTSRSSSTQITTASAAPVTALAHDDFMVKKQSAEDAIATPPRDEQYFSDAILLDRLARAMVRAEHMHESVAVLCLDIEWLQRVHDALGQDAGQRMMREIHSRITASVRITDTIQAVSPNQATLDFSMVGHREIVLLIADLPPDTCVQGIADRIKESFRPPISLDDQEIDCSLSIGASTYPKNTLDAKTLLYQATAAKHQASRQSPGSAICIYSEQVEAASRMTIQFETDLIRAIENNQMFLLFQPKVDLVEGRIAGFEALLRWQHPQRGLVPPIEFIPIAEKTGLIHKLSRWVVHTACQQIVYWREHGYGDINVSVNLSPVEFGNKNLATSILNEIEQLSINPGCLEVEITESISLDNIESAKEVLENLSRHGVTVSIDDFGTGFASMSYLQQLPIDKIKIDRSFVQDILTNNTDAAIVSGLINLGNALGLLVIAEGIETVEQLRYLQDLGCDQVQGYFLGKPMNKHDAENLLASPDALLELIVAHRHLSGNNAFCQLGSDLTLINPLPRKLCAGG